MGEVSWWNISVQSLAIFLSAVLVLSCEQTDRHTDTQNHRGGWLARCTHATTVISVFHAYTCNTRTHWLCVTHVTRITHYMCANVCQILTSVSCFRCCVQTGDVATRWAASCAAATRASLSTTTGPTAQVSDNAMLAEQSYLQSLWETYWKKEMNRVASKYSRRPQ